jgi:hypothetical protein
MSTQPAGLAAELSVEDLWPRGCTDSMGTRARNAVLREGVTTAGALAALSDGELLDMRHIAHGLGITYRQLNYWVKRGYLRPEHDGGSGVARRWPAAEAEIARRMSRLISAGIDVAAAAAFARNDWPDGEIAPGIRIEVAA